MKNRWGALILGLGVVVITAHPAVADHMNGRYFGTGAWADFTLETLQSGRAVEGRLARCGQPVLVYDGFSDGGDYASGDAEDTRTGDSGWFELVWSPGGVAFQFGVADEQWQARFGGQPVANNCGGGDGRGEERGRTPERDTPGDRFGDEGEGGREGADGPDPNRERRGDDGGGAGGGGGDAILPEF